MELKLQDPRTLRDLALIYIALTDSTDQDMADSEVEVVARRLQAWQTEAPFDGLRHAVREAAAAYAGNGSAQAVEEAIDHLREAVPAEAQRQAILEDLVDVALADDRFLHEESTFIERLARQWDVRLNDSSPEDARKWSILSQDTRTGDWTAVHDLALLYLMLADSDDDLSTREVTAITEKLNEWLPDAKEIDVLAIVQQAIQVYTEEPQHRPLADAVDAIGRFLPEHQRTALLADLHYVARADGVLLEREQFVIEQIARIWNLELPRS